MNARKNFDAAMNGLLSPHNGINYNSRAPKKGNSIERIKASQIGNSFRTPSSRGGSSSNPNYNDIDIAPNFKAAETPKELVEFIGQVLDPVGEGIGPDFTRPIKNFGKDALSRAGDIISRPLYGTYNGYVESKEAQLAREENKDNNGLFDFDFGNLGDDFKNFGSGFLKGFTGAPDEDPNKTNKSTPGEAVELFTKKDFERWQDEDRFLLGNEEFQKWTKRTAGFTGEVFGDPANLLGGAVVGKLKSGADYADTAARNLDFSDKTAKALQGNPLENLSKPGGLRTPTGARSGGKRTAVEFTGEDLAQAADDAILTSNQSAVAASNAVTRDAMISRAVASLADEATKKFNGIYDKLVNGSLHRAKPAYKNALSDPMVKAFEDEYVRITNNMAANGAVDSAKAIREAADVARDSILPHIDEYAAKLENELRGSMYNTFALRVGPKKIPINVLGRGVEAIKQKGLRAPKALSINRQLPGRALQHTAQARRAGHVSYEAFRGRIKDVARLYTRSDRLEINKHLMNGTLPGNHLDQGINAIRDEYAKVLKSEVQAGVRESSSVIPPNYFALHFKENPLKPFSAARKQKIADIKATRKAEGSASKPFSVGVDDIPSDLKVIKDPFEALSHRVLKAERNISRSYVNDAFFRTYGISGQNLTPALAKQQGWRRVASYNNGKVKSFGAPLNKDLEAYVLKTGEDLYLPADVGEAFDYYNNITNVGRRTGAGKELNEAIRVYDKLLNFFKTTATVPYPGFHVKNMAGDIFMGLMDGVGFSSYSKYIKSVKGGTYRMGNSQIDKALLDDVYLQKATSGGFVETELDPTAKFSARTSPRAAGQKARELSEMREDFGRQVHFAHALEEELDKIPNFKGDLTKADVDTKAFQRAADNAAQRVDKFKFDYGALTATEKNVMRRVIPFYTFMRKSAPMMLESMALHPSTFGKTQRFFDDNDIPGLAPWQRELGLANISGGDEPLLLPETVLPYDSLLDMTSDPSLKGGLDFLLSGSSPLIKAPLELAFNQNSFTGADLYEGDSPSIKETLDHLAGSNFAPLRTGQDLVKNPDKLADPKEFLLGNRLALGTAVRRLDSDTQMQNLQGDVSYVKNKLRELSLQARPLGLKIDLSERSSGTSVKVKRSVDGKYVELYEGTLPEALEVFSEAVKNTDPDPGQEVVEYINKDNHLKYGPRSTAETLGRILEN